MLVEALLRVGLATHVLWLCRLNARVWELALGALETETPPSIEQVERVGWDGHDAYDPLLELGRDGNTAIKNRIQSYVQARIGLNLLLHALDDGGCGWTTSLGVVDGLTPPQAIVSFLQHVSANRSAVESALEPIMETTSLRDAANRLADENPRLLGMSTGFPKNLLEFLRYSLVQLQAQEDELKSYDQAYLLYRRSRTANSWPVQPGPAALIVMVHGCCRSAGGVPASLDDFKAYLSEYGLLAPAGELQVGQTARDLGLLGLVVDSPDAGGGRLLVDPF